MITISHNRARITLKPEKAEGARTLLALIDKTEGQKGAKMVREKGNSADDSNKRNYPGFYAGLATGYYVANYHKLNEHKGLSKLEFTFADRAAPMLDATIEEIREEPDPDYVFVAPVAKANAAKRLSGPSP